MRSWLPRRRDHGASAVEFALVAPLLFSLLFGVVDYGLYFADVLTVQQGLSDQARAATLAPGVLRSGTSCGLMVDASDPLAGGQLQAVACGVLHEVTPIAGQVYVRAELVDADGGPASWTAGSRLRVCTITDHPPVLPMVPLPAGGRILTHVDMPVQARVSGLTSPLAPVWTPAPAGSDWGWC